MIYFTEEEIACSCGCGIDNVSSAFMDKLTSARIDAGIPFSMNSICRCPVHNKAEDGSEGSSHISTEEQECTAGDISCRDSRSRFIIIAALIKAGFTRIGIAKTFIHVDDDKTKSVKVTWLY